MARPECQGLLNSTSLRDEQECAPLRDISNPRSPFELWTTLIGHTPPLGSAQALSRPTAAPSKDLELSGFKRFWGHLALHTPFQFRKEKQCVHPQEKDLQLILDVLLGRCTEKGLSVPRQGGSCVRRRSGRNYHLS